MANLFQFAREVKQEGQKVTWPQRRETLMTTFVVFLMVVAFALMLMLADWMISSTVKFILGLGQ
ncbi:MAG: preprotein translocase subunit SecE [Bdellovibrionales bacterium]|nr:preprotein translocase subunit SecE [Bdellovibrionales bacterium]